MGFTFWIQQSMVPNRDRYQSTVFEKGESLSLGIKKAYYPYSGPNGQIW